MDEKDEKLKKNRRFGIISIILGFISLFISTTFIIFIIQTYDLVIDIEILIIIAVSAILTPIVSIIIGLLAYRNSKSKTGLIGVLTSIGALFLSTLPFVINIDF